MGIGDKAWEALSTVIRMNDKVEALARNMTAMNAKIENLTERLIRLETALEIGLSAGQRRLPAPKSRRDS
jgi:hypothetical protein